MVVDRSRHDSLGRYRILLLLENQVQGIYGRMERALVKRIWFLYWWADLGPSKAIMLHVIVNNCVG